MSKIEWTQATWNPAVGCSKISAGCKNCYAEAMAKRLQAMGTKGYENGFEFTIIPERLEVPRKKKKSTIFFVGSMTDIFHERMPFSYLDDIFGVMTEMSPFHTFQVLTKRPKIMADYLKSRQITKLSESIFFGVTVENRTVKRRIELLKDTPADIKFYQREILQLLSRHDKIVLG